MDAIAYVVPGQVAYLQLPSEGLRAFADSCFPKLAIFPIADSAAGMGHRWKAGHDILIDVPATFARHGTVDGFKHLGHIVLTDFPTKAGIPVPGFSHSGLGHLLTEWGIPKGWLSLTICDAGIGILAVAESHSDLLAALAGHMHMGVATFFDTFVEGGVEIALTFFPGVYPPLLLVGGIENVLAGIVSTWKTYSVYVDPMTVLGGTFCSAIIGATVGYYLAKDDPLPSSLTGAIRSGAVGMCFSLSTAFGFGAFGGLVVYTAGRTLAKHHAAQYQTLLSVDQAAYQLLVDTICAGQTDYQKFAACCLPRIMLLDAPLLLPDEVKVLPSNVPLLDTESRTLSTDWLVLDSASMTLDDTGAVLPMEHQTLSDEAAVLNSEAAVLDTEFKPPAS